MLNSSTCASDFVGDEEKVLRLVWSPDDLDPDTNELSTSAFPKNDLLGDERGVSVDRKTLAQLSCILCVAERQQRKAADHPTLVRHDILLVEAEAGAVRLKNPTDGVSMLDVISSPIGPIDECPANPAHAEIRNISGKKSGGELNKIRVHLQLVFSGPKRYSEYFPDASS